MLVMRPTAFPICLLLATACMASDDDGASEDSRPTVHVAVAATLELPPVTNAPARLRVIQYGLQPGSEPQTGQCAVLLLDPINRVEWQIEAQQAWDSTEVRGDTTFVHHTVIGDYVPGSLTTYEMTPGQIIRVDCAAYGVLGLARSGG